MFIHCTQCVSLRILWCPEKTVLTRSEEGIAALHNKVAQMLEIIRVLQCRTGTPGCSILQVRRRPNKFKLRPWSYFLVWPWSHATGKIRFFLDTCIFSLQNESTRKVKARCLGEYVTPIYVPTGDIKFLHSVNAYNFQSVVYFIALVIIPFQEIIIYSNNLYNINKKQYLSQNIQKEFLQEK